MFFVGITAVVLGLIVGLLAAINPIDPEARMYVSSAYTRRWRRRIAAIAVILIVLGIVTMLR